MESDKALTQNIDSLSKLFRRYIMPEWKAIGSAQIISLIVMVLNLLSLGLFAALPVLLISRFGDGRGVAEKSAMSGGGVDVGAILSWLQETAESIADSQGVIEAVVFISSCYLFVVFATRVLQFAGDRIILESKTRATRNLIKDAFHHVLNLSMDFFHRQKSGDMVTRINFDAKTLSMAAFDALNALVMALPMFIIYWLLMFKISWRLTFAIIAVFGLKIYVTDKFSKHISNAISKMAASRGGNAQKLIEVLSNISIVKAFCSEDFEKSAFNTLVDAQTSFDLQRRVYEIKEKTLQNILQSIAVVATVMLGLVMLLDGVLALSALILFFFTANRAQEPTRMLLRFIIDLRKAQGVSSRVIDVFKEKTSVIDGTREVSGFDDCIDFKGVSFSYLPNQACVEGVNLTLRKGEVIAIVGPSGAGKSTLLNLLLRFFDPDEGRVLSDGVDVREFRQESYRRLFGVVTQDPILFNASIRDNIAYAASAEDISGEDILRAAKIAHVHKFVEELDNGYNTIIGDRGVRLSGGQKQRVTLARAILRNPSILILDEATSSLDSESEHLIQQAIDEFLAGRTAVIVAHRLSTINKADRIIVMDNGRIIQAGTHDELMAKDGRFRRLCEAQLGASKSS